MKASNKFTTVAASVILVTIGLAGCSNGTAGAASDCAGNWVVESMESEGQVFTAEQIAEIADTGYDMANVFSLQLNEDGVANMVVMEEKTVGTWEPADSACAITFEGDTEIVPIEAGKLTLGIDGKKATFKRA